jgi:hypothetical protein
LRHGKGLKRRTERILCQSQYRPRGVSPERLSTNWPQNQSALPSYIEAPELSGGTKKLPADMCIEVVREI